MRCAANGSSLELAPDIAPSLGSVIKRVGEHQNCCSRQPFMTCATVQAHMGFPMSKSFHPPRYHSILRRIFNCMQTIALGHKERKARLVHLHFINSPCQIRQLRHLRLRAKSIYLMQHPVCPMFRLLVPYIRLCSCFGPAPSFTHERAC